jgi:Co/Zn/Cd efflux system component
MQRLLVQLANVFVLVVIVIGVPAITSLRFGSVRLLSDARLQMLTLGGFGLAVAVNLIGAIAFSKDRKGRNTCWTWALLFALMLAAEYAYIRGYLQFGWLKDLLLWAEEKF